VVEKLNITSDVVLTKVFELSNQIRACQIGFAAVIAIKRGGAVPASDLSLMLDLPYAEVYVSCYDGEVKRETPIVEIEALKQFQGRNVILVDDLIDSGQTIQILKLECKKLDIDPKVAVLYQKPHAVIKPDFCTETTTKWIVFPWEQD